MWRDNTMLQAAHKRDDKMLQAVQNGTTILLPIGSTQCAIIRFLRQRTTVRGNTDGIPQCGMSRATLEATGRCHRVTTRSLSPRRPPGQQANKQQSTNTPTLLAVLMAMAMCRYVTAHIAQWRRSRASLEATRRCHRASVMSNNIKGTWLHRFFDVLHHQNCRKRSWIEAKAPVFNKGMTYQSKEKALTKVSIYFAGGVELAE
jgi:hypothetical protein